MRKTWDSSSTASTCWLSARASSRRVPNGFSITTRTSAPGMVSSPCSPSLPTITGKNAGAVER